jgi:N-acyl homoserine lactone hydrolase
MAPARKLLGMPKKLQLFDGDTDLFGDGSVAMIATSGHTSGDVSALVHPRKSGFITLSGDGVVLESNFQKNIVPSLNQQECVDFLHAENPRIDSDL